MNFRTCPNCYHANSDDNIRCLRCGKALDENNSGVATESAGTKTSVCPKCRRYNLPNAWTCIDCGETLSIKSVVEIDSSTIDHALPDEKNPKPKNQGYQKGWRHKKARTKVKVCQKCGKINAKGSWKCIDCKDTLSVKSFFDEEEAESISQKIIFKKETQLQEIIDKLVELENPKKAVWENLLYLGFSILLFISFGLLANPVIDLMIIVGVLLIHETGHYVAMTLFGYKDVKMFFIPLFGAAVSGKPQNVSATKKAIVTLAGPLPGIFLGFVLGIISILFNNSILAQASLMLVFINGFNLLPVFPFDGGRFLFDVVFSRNRYIEAIFKFIAGSTLVIGAIYLQDIIIGIIGLIVFITISPSLKIGSIAKELEQEHDFILYSSLLEATPEIIDKVITKILNEFPNNKNPKTLANLTSELWNRLSVTHPNLFISVVLVMLYILSLVFVILPII